MADYRGRRIRLPINWSARQLAILEMAARDYRESVAESTVEPVPHSDRPQQHHHNLPSSTNIPNNDLAGAPTSEDEAPAMSRIRTAATDGPEYNKTNFVDVVPPGFKQLISEHYIKHHQGAAEQPARPSRDPFSDMIERLIQERIASQDPNTIARHFQVPDHLAAISSQEATTSTAASASTAPANKEGEAETECVGFQPCIVIVEGMNAALDRLIDGPLASINRETNRMHAILAERRKETDAHEKENAVIKARIAEQERFIALYKGKELDESRRELAAAKAENARLEEELKKETKAKKAKDKKARTKVNKKAKAEAEQDATAETGGEDSEEAIDTTIEGSSGNKD